MRDKVGRSRLRGLGVKSMQIGRVSLILFVLVAVLSIAGSSSAQIVTGDITGTVTDQSGASVADADLLAVCPDTDQKHTSKSGSIGEYRLSDLPSCVYKVSASASGFKTTVRYVTVTVAHARRLHRNETHRQFHLRSIHY
jgi:Carboxypeptidase regulatory-like domain